MSYATAIAEVNTILQSATGLSNAKFYTYERHTAHWSDYISSFKDTTNNIIHGYLSTQINFESILETSYTVKTTRTFLIRGFYSMASSGATETTFQTLLDNIKTKFIAKPKLNSTVLTVNSFRADPIELLMFGDVLCHYAEMRIETEEEETYTT